MSIVLIGGGSRSGKSRYALEVANRFGSRRFFLATAEPLDAEMSERILRHQQERGTAFTTVEEPLELDRAVNALEGCADCVVIDCLTLWVSNAMHHQRESTLETILRRLADSPLPCIVVTNEVGCGIVPENAMARRFRDLAGSINQLAGALAVEAYWMAFGIPVRLK
jgi:adenosylcobinamide kinase / adenosylcobinamide-phosphate guanylyltransferase